MKSAIVWRWVGNAAIAFIVAQGVDSRIPVSDGLALIGLGLIFGMDVMRGGKEGWR